MDASKRVGSFQVQVIGSFVEGLAQSINAYVLKILHRFLADNAYGDGTFSREEARRQGRSIQRIDRDDLPVSQPCHRVQGLPVDPWMALSDGAGKVPS